MIRSGMIRAVFLLTLGIIAIALVGFPAGATGDSKGHCLDNETCMTLQQSSMGDRQCNGTMTCCMVDENMSNKSCMAEMGQNNTMKCCTTGKSTMKMADPARMDCASASLKKAMELHMLHMKGHRMNMNESEMEMMGQMMDHMMQAYECMTGENMTMGKNMTLGMMNNTTGVKFSEEHNCGCKT
jgi:hypothetical protein